MNVRRSVRVLISSLDLKSTGKWFLFSAVIGVASGLGAIVFQYLCQVVLFGLGATTGYFPPEPDGEALRFPHGEGEISIWLVVLILMAGGLVAGWLVYTFAPEAEGHGTDAAIDAFHRKRGYIRPRATLIKMLASAATIGTGGSGGREGPIAQIGAGFGSLLATKLKLSARDRRILLAVGMGAGVGAIFRAPLAGALFAGEILYKEAEFESDVIMPTAIASIISYSVYALSLPEEMRFTPLFGERLQFDFISFFEFLPLTLLAIVLTLAGILYIKVFYSTHRLFQKVPIPRHFRPILGAAATGIVAAVLFYSMGEDPRVLAVLSTGYGIIQDVLDPSMKIGVGLLFAVALGKVLTTSLTIGSGGSGGVFGPSMVIGGCLGAAVGDRLHFFWPEVVTQPKAYVIVGMAGFFAGCARAPISTLIMVSEMTGDYKLLMPVMWVSTLCFLLCRRWTLYEKQVPTRLESQAHRGDFIVDILEDIKVSEVFEPGPVGLVPESTTLEEILRMIAHDDQDYFPVVNEEESLVGIFTAKDVRAYFYDEAIWKVTIARDIMVTDVLSVTPLDDLNTALRRFTQRNIEELPVMDPERPDSLLGMLRRKETIAFYNRRLLEQKKDRD